MSAADLAALVRSFSNLHVTVIGDAMLDTYSTGSAERICREAPVPIVTLGERLDAPGGAANAAANAAALGAQVDFIGVTGNDAEGLLLRAALDACGVGHAQLIGLPERQTLSKHRVLAGSHMLVRLDQGTTEAIDEVTEARVVNALVESARESEAIIVSDYEYGVMTPRVIGAVRDIQARHPTVLIVDAKDLRRYSGCLATAVKPNYAEAVGLAGMHLESGSTRTVSAEVLGERVLEATGARIAAVTLDSDGAILFERGAPPYRTYGRQDGPVHTAGAGDTFAAAMALALASGAGTTEAAELASGAAAIAVTKHGTSVCWTDELQHHVLATDKYHGDVSALAAHVALLRQQRKRIVFTNGCFDIIHRGHVTYLSQAKALGDVLVVGVNSDASTQMLKGPERPINPLDDRLSVLAAMSCVDHLIAFEEETPERIIAAIRPDVFVKGGDYTRETLPEAALVESLGGTVRFLPFVEALSTTSIIQKVRHAFAAGASED
ncbi:MAG: D-glycero-beta-D-manno-heptose 1-phosphate adenylyltransferase [Dehalococcoidia bacterium]